MTYFLRNLPGEITRRIRIDRPSTLEEVFDSAREWDRIAKVSRRRISDTEIKPTDTDQEQADEDEDGSDTATEYVPSYHHINTSVAPPSAADDTSSPMDLDTLSFETRRMTETRRRKVRKA